MIKAKDWINNSNKKAKLLQYLMQKKLSEIWDLDFDEQIIEAAYFRMKLGEPITKISGFTKFYNRFFLTSPDVLDPRPETELLIILASKYIQPNYKVLDLGCGSGCIGITLALEYRIQVDLSDISANALKVAQANVNRLSANCRIFQSNWCNSLTDMYDIILCNPPYVPLDYEAPIELVYDPYLALFSELNGFAAHYQAFLSVSSKIKQNGIIIWEIGFQQEYQFREFISKLGYYAIFYPDFNNILRAAVIFAK